MTRRLPPWDMEGFRVEHFIDVVAFLDLLKRHDDSFMNFIFGTLLDRLNPEFYQSKEVCLAESTQRTLLAVFCGNNLLWVISWSRPDRLQLTLFL